MTKKRRPRSKAGTPGLNWLVLAESDDFITRNLIDNIYYWIKTRKVGRGFQKPLKIDNTTILGLLRKCIIDTDNPNIKKCSGLLMKHPVTRKFLERYGDDEHVLTEFRLHLQRYMGLFHPDCGFEVNVTDRYKSRSGSEEACIVARRDYDEGEEIKFLTGSFAELLPEDELSLDQNDFSVINISSRELPCLMLGPSRFVNHNCSSNARFGTGGKGMKIIAVRRILTGEEITVTYSPNYFGRDNKDCLCATCERDHKGFFDPDRFEIPDTAPLIDVPTSEDEDDNKVDIIVIDDSDHDTKESTPMSKNGQDTSDSDTSPELLDPGEVLNWGKKLSILRQAPLTAYQEMGLFHKIPQQAKGDLIGGRVLRSRNKIQAPSSQSNQRSIMDLFPTNTSLDTLALKSEGIEKEILKVRAQNRTLHSLFTSEIYPKNLMEARELKTTYDCLHCGIYFKVDSQHKVKGYCHRCCRHQRIYRLAWPYTRHTPMKTFSLLLEEKIGRASIGELAQREIVSLSRQAISPKRLKTSDIARHSPERVSVLMPSRIRWSPQGDCKLSSPGIYCPGRKSILDEFTSDSSEDEYHSAQEFEAPVSPLPSKTLNHSWNSAGSPVIKELKLTEADEKQLQSTSSQLPLSSRPPRTRSTTAALSTAESNKSVNSKLSAKPPEQLPTRLQMNNSQSLKFRMSGNNILLRDQESPIKIDSESADSDDSNGNSPIKEEILISPSKIHLEKKIRQSRQSRRSRPFYRPVNESLTITKKKIIIRSSGADALHRRSGSRHQKAFLEKSEEIIVISDSDSEDAITGILL